MNTSWEKKIPQQKELRKLQLRKFLLLCSWTIFKIPFMFNAFCDVHTHNTQGYPSDGKVFFFISQILDRFQINTHCLKFLLLFPSIAFGQTSSQSERKKKKTKIEKIYFYCSDGTYTHSWGIDVKQKNWK